MQRDLQALYDRGLRAVAICLIHSYTYPGKSSTTYMVRANSPDHEQQIARIAEKIGFTQISLSSSLSPAIKALPRGNSAVIDAYLSPVLRAYVDGFNSHFAGKKAGRRSEFMKSDGGLVSSDKWVPEHHSTIYVPDSECLYQGSRGYERYYLDLLVGLSVAH